jgi:glycosyltransferase involved in cell wall biosynthesis
MSERLRILVYWHGIAFPHSRYVVEGFDEEPSGAEILAIGPRELAGASSIFKVGTASGATLRKTRLLPVKTYRVRETWCRLSEWFRQIRRFEPDIIIVLDEATSINTLLAGIVNRLFGRGIVLFYGFENVMQYPGWTNFLHRPTVLGAWNCIRRTARFVLIDWMLMPLRRRLIHGGLVSYQECADVVQAMGLSPPMRRQWWAVNDRVFVPQGPRADFGFGDRYVFGFVGRFTEEKGITDLIRALAALDDSYALVLIGDGPLAPTIRSLAHELGVESRMRVVPPQDQLSLAASYRALDLIVLPSRGTATWKEQYGRVLMEAMRCGVAAAGSTSGAIPTIIQDPAAIFPEGDVAAMAAVIKRIRACPPQQDELRQRCIGTGAVEFATAWMQFSQTIRATTRPGKAYRSRNSASVS